MALGALVERGQRAPVGSSEKCFHWFSKVLSSSFKSPYSVSHTGTCGYLLALTRSTCGANEFSLVGVKGEDSYLLHQLLVLKNRIGVIVGDDRHCRQRPDGHRPALPSSSRRATASRTLGASSGSIRGPSGG